MYSICVYSCSVYTSSTLVKVNTLIVFIYGERKTDR